MNLNYLLLLFLFPWWFFGILLDVPFCHPSFEFCHLHLATFWPIAYFVYAQSFLKEKLVIMADIVHAEWVYDYFNSNSECFSFRCYSPSYVKTSQCHRQHGCCLAGHHTCRDGSNYYKEILSFILLSWWAWLSYKYHYQCVLFSLYILSIYVSLQITQCMFLEDVHQPALLLMISGAWI